MSIVESRGRKPVAVWDKTLKHWRQSSRQKTCLILPYTRCFIKKDPFLFFFTIYSNYEQIPAEIQSKNQSITNFCRVPPTESWMAALKSLDPPKQYHKSIIKRKKLSKIQFYDSFQTLHYTEIVNKLTWISTWMESQCCFASSHNSSILIMIQI